MTGKIVRLYAAGEMVGGIFYLATRAAPASSGLPYSAAAPARRRAEPGANLNQVPLGYELPQRRDITKIGRPRCVDRGAPAQPERLAC